MTNSYLFDKLLPFSKKGNVVMLNLFQIYIIRYGIGNYLSKKICKYPATHFLVRLKKYYLNDINEFIKEVFIYSQTNLDNILNDKMLISLHESILLYDNRGRMYLAKLPINGQRRRSSKKTNRRVRPI